MSKKTSKAVEEERTIAKPMPPYVGVHPMAEIVNDPESTRRLTAVGLCSVDGMPGQFCAFAVTFCGDKVENVEFSQHDFKVGAQRRAQTEFVTRFLANKPV